MLRLFRKVTQRELEEINEQLKLNASNNYRDATLDNLRELEAKYHELTEKGRLSEEQIGHYGKMIEAYKEEFKGFTHKEQKAGW